MGAERACALVFVVGKVYIDDINKRPDNLSLIFPDQIIDIYVYFDGRFSIIFDDKEPGTIGTFLVIYQGKKYIPPETVTIENGVYTYIVDLHVDTEGGGRFDPFEEGWIYRKMITVNHESDATKCYNILMKMQKKQKGAKQKGAKQKGPLEINFFFRHLHGRVKLSGPHWL